MFKRIVDKINRNEQIKDFKRRKDSVVRKIGVMSLTLYLLYKEKINGLGKDNCEEIIKDVLGNQQFNDKELEEAFKRLKSCGVDLKKDFWENLPDKGNLEPEPEPEPEPHIDDNINNQFKKYREKVLEKIYSIAQ